MKRTVKVGIVGLGVRTEVLLAAFLRMDDLEVIAVCDLYEEPIKKILGIFEKYGKPAPKTFTDYRDMLKIDELEAVFIPTSWNSHLAIAADCMEAGKYAAIEVGGAASIDELWQLVHAYERTKTPVMMLENCCYCRNELMVMNMVRKGLFGELIYCEGGYEHNLRNTLAQMETSGEERAYHNRFRNGELYPTHEVGPLAKILRINRGNRFLSLTSSATKSRSIPEWRREQTASGNGSYPDVPFNQGDIITTVIKCANGENITLTHSVSLPRPYSRNGRVQGTKGIWLEDVNGIYIEGISKDEVKIDPAGNPYDVHYWTPVEELYEEYDHPIWRKYKDNLLGGHGGLDSLVIRAFLDAVRNRENTPIDVYDVAAWMAITCLSEQSIALGSMPVAFPDFTNGKWIRREPAPKNQWNIDDVYEELFEE
ncbi:MAG: Gfo/Idh/MocA family oxidoreductase [Oscillospiraceae bacterium]|nr:Gfo/Idh/MocA family oxidoreductase [Oscillospiraceae bacterium]